MDESLGTAKYREKFDAADRQHMRRVRKLRAQVLEDESLPDLDRAVLGATGSFEELYRHQRLAEKIGSLVGQPIIRIDRIEREQVTEASGGIVLGPVEASSNSTPRSDEKHFHNSKLSVPVSPSISWWVSRSMRPVYEQEKVFFDQENTMYDKDRGISKLEIANISAVYPYRQAFKVLDPYSEFEHRIPHQDVLVGREEIYNHDLFSHGIHKVLTALDGRAAEVEAESQAVS
jgi:hypothetical protein